MKRRTIWLSLPLVFGLSVATTLATGFRLAHAADDPCTAFTWDVRCERALFGIEPQPITAGRTPTALPALAADRLYQLKLSVESDVKFLRPPGKKLGGDGGYAGLARLTVDLAGVYDAWAISVQAVPLRTRRLKATKHNVATWRIALNRSRLFV